MTLDNGETTFLNDVALDNTAANSTKLTASSSGSGGVFVDHETTNNTLNKGLGTLSNFWTPPPPAVDRLTTAWNSTGATTRTIYDGWTNYPLVVGGSNLVITSGTPTAGSFSSTLSASAVPGAGLAGLATIGLAGVARRRR